MSVPAMIPRRLLFLLVAVVLALHALLLAGASASGQSPRASAPLVFETRMVVAPPASVPLPAPAPAVRAAPPTDPPAAALKPKTRAAAPRPAPAVPDSVAPSPAAVQWAAPSQSELLALGAATDGETAPGPPPIALEPPALLVSAPEPLQAQATSAPAPDGAQALATPQAAGKNPAGEPAPVKLPPSTRLNFEVNGKAKGFGYNARAELLWEHDATSYSARQEVSVIFLGSRSQTSVGSITEAGLQPRRFGDRSRSERAAHFDFASGTVSFSANTPAAPIEPGAQDRLSVFLQLAGLLAAAPQRYPVGTQIAMTTVSARSADVWTFTVEGEQVLELPVGTLRTVQLQRLPRREHDQKAQVWLAPELGYLPARIRITEANGDFVELNLGSHEAP